MDRRALRLLSRYREPDLPRQGRIHTFVQQLSGLQEGVAAIVQRVLAVRGGDPVRMRGVYLTSALQDGEPVIDAVLENLAKKTRGSFTAPPPDPVTSRRVFADDLVGTIVLRDSLLARRTTKLLQRAAIRRGVVGVSLGLVGLYVAIGSTGSARRNRDLAQQTADTSAATAADLGGKRRAPVDVAKIVGLRDLLSRWEDESGEDEGDVRGWGLFRGEVTPPLQGFYKRAVIGGVIAVLRDKAEAELRDFAARFESPDLIPDFDDRSQRREALRFYLLVTTNKKKYEKQPVSDEKEWLDDTLRRRWLRARGSNAQAEYTSIERSVKKFMALAVDGDFKMQRDEGLVEQVQEILKREDSVKAEVEKIIEEVSGKEDLAKINLRTLTGLPDIENDGTEVRGAFTIEGWAYVKSALASALESDSWVLGLEQSQAEMRQRRRGAEMRTIYFNMYIEEWRRFISRTRIAPPTSLDAGKRLMSELVKGPRLPLWRVYNELKRHSELTDDYNYGDNRSLMDLLSKSKDRGARDLIKADSVRREFAKLVAFAVAPEGKEGTVGLDQYHNRLKEVRDAIGKALEDKALEKALVEVLDGAIEDTIAMVQDAELDTWTAGTRKLLLAPLEELRKMLVREQGTGAVADWCARIVDPMHERFGGRYPFDPESRSDAAVADFEEFFHPETGVIRKAREELISGYVVLNGNTIELRDRGRSEGPKLDPGVVKFLNRAQDISSVMFVNEELRVDFELILACNPQVSKVEVVVEGKKVEFACGTERPTRLRWPGKENPGASLTAFGRQGRKQIPYTGEWGLFELFEKPPSALPDFKGEEVILFRFDMAAFNLGQLDVRIQPTRVRGGTAFFGLPSGPKTYLSLIRSPDVLPPKRLFSNMAGCGGA